MAAPTASKDFSSLTVGSVLADADEVYNQDASEGTATNKPKRVTWTTIKAFLKTYFDTLYQPLDSILTNTTASYTSAEETKLAGIETAADVTDTTNVTAAGALMDSEVDADIKTLVLPASTTISAFGATLVDDADAVAARTTLGLDTPLNNQTGTTYAVVLADAAKMITMSNAAANTATLPANASIAFPVGSEVSFMQLGAGATTIAITTDTLSVESSLTLVLAGQYAVATAKKVTSTQWVLFGNLTAS